MSVCAVFIWFVIYSIFGWIYESTYCTINERRWENRGFLYGPVCPIYGIGIIFIILMWHVAEARGIDLAWWQIFLCSFFGSIILEYSTHWALEKLFHAYWWDYSNMPLNVNGRICLPASLLFGVGGLAVVRLLYVPTLALTAEVSETFIEVISLLLMALIAADTAITVSALSRFARAAGRLNDSVNAHMEQFVAGAVEKGEAAAAGLAERRDGAVDAIDSLTDSVARERDRFAATIQDSILGELPHNVRSAARRVKGFVTIDRMPNIPGAKYLSSLLGQVRGKHWARK